MYEFWDRFKSIASVTMAVVLSLYLLRCLVAWDFISVARFGGFLQGLIGYILRR